jgi:uncharacterized protein
VKFGLLLLLVVLVLVYFKRPTSKTEKVKPSVKPEAQAPGQVAAMAVCALCSVHLPLSEALTGNKGHYCCSDHLHQSEP